MLHKSFVNTETNMLVSGFVVEISERPVCPLCHTKMLPGPTLKDSTGKSVYTYACNCVASMRDNVSFAV